MRIILIGIAVLLMTACREDREADRFTLNYYVDYKIKKSNGITFSVDGKVFSFGFDDTLTRVLTRNPFLTVNNYDYNNQDVFQIILNKGVNIYDVKTPYVAKTIAFKDMDLMSDTLNVTDTLSMGCKSMALSSIPQNNRDSFYHVVTSITKDLNNVAILEGNFKIKCYGQEGSLDTTVLVEGSYRVPFYTTTR